MKVLGIDHVQLAIPPGGEERARWFYGQVLGLVEVPKPEALRGRGGLWFQAGPVQLHLGVEPQMRPSAKGNYLSITCTVTATSQQQLDALYRELSSHPMVKVVL